VAIGFDLSDLISSASSSLPFAVSFESLCFGAFSSDFVTSLVLAPYFVFLISLSIYSFFSSTFLALSNFSFTSPETLSAFASSLSSFNNDFFFPFKAFSRFSISLTLSASFYLIYFEDLLFNSFIYFYRLSISFSFLASLSLISFSASFFMMTSFLAFLP